ncbi:hypothetical protein [Mastigocoleus testarum]|nr:hypothetical protein [Mastigocoleus testarum]
MTLCRDVAEANADAAGSATSLQNGNIKMYLIQMEAAIFKAIEALLWILC